MNNISEEVKSILNTCVNQDIKRIYLHIGMDKAGSTSIQDTLKINTDVLNNLNVKYMFPKVGHSNMFIGDTFFNKRVNVNMYRLLNELTSNKNEILVFSGELMCGMQLKDIKVLKGILNYVAPNADIKIVFITRNKASYFISGIQQRIKTDDLDKNGFSHIYRPKIMYFVKVFGKENIIAYKFEDSLNHEYKVVGCFLEKIGIPLERIDDFEIVKSNESVSDKAIYLIKYINEHISVNFYINEYFKRFKGDTLSIRKIRGEKFRPPVEEIIKVMKNGKDDTVWLKNNFDIEYEHEYEGEKDRRQLFNEDYYDDIVDIFNELSYTLQLLTYRYILETLEDTVDEKSRLTLQKIKVWIEKKNDNKFIGDAERISRITQEFT